MKDCKFTCPEILPSGCIPYTGEVPCFMDTEECRIMIDDVLEQTGEQVCDILDQIDLTGLNKLCLDFTPATVTVKALHQVEINKICALDTALTALQAQFEALNIGDELITIDLDCMTPVAAPCDQGTNTYTLLTILTIFRDEICNIKSQL